ncbi:MAG: hypothetical protein JNK76_25400 [Planctomycetales bacterium]|nr:hypothetical protein [Planctomycetales bacterium]
MQRPDRQSVLQFVPAELTALRAAITAAYAPERLAGTPSDIIRFQFPKNAFGPAEIELFRKSDWLVLPHSDPYFGPDQVTVVIRAKQVIDPTPSICFHATLLDRERSIRERGLVPGHVVAAPPKCAQFSDSSFYIFVSATIDDARGWIRIFDEERKSRWVILPIDCRDIRLLYDPCSRGANAVPGWILETDHVGPERIGESIVVD